MDSPHLPISLPRVRSKLCGSLGELAPPQCSRFALAFHTKGWAKSKALAKKGKVAYKNKKKVKNLVITGKTVKLYAVWVKK